MIVSQIFIVLPLCHEGCLQPRHSSLGQSLHSLHKKLSSLSPRVSVCFSPQLCFHRGVIIFPGLATPALTTWHGQLQNLSAIQLVCLSFDWVNTFYIDHPFVPFLNFYYRSGEVCHLSAPLLSLFHLPSQQCASGQMFIVFVCNMFTYFQKFGISSLHIGELLTHMGGGGSLERLNMPLSVQCQA